MKGQAMSETITPLDWQRGIMRDHRLKSRVKLVALHLLDEVIDQSGPGYDPNGPFVRGDCITSIRRICQLDGIGETTARRALARLDECGWIVIEPGDPLTVDLTIPAGIDLRPSCEVLNIADYRKAAGQ